MSVALLVGASVVLQGSLALLAPGTGVWTDAATASWGNETIVLPALEHPVTVIRDGSGTVHIYAQDDPDLFYAQGYTQASDRLFQMEVESLSAQGNLSSWLGPSALASDEMYRYLGVPQAAAAMAAGVAAEDPSVAQDMNAYVAGVNAYIDWAEAHHALSLAFKVLGVQPYRWSLFASFCFDRLMVIGQTTGFTEPLYAAVEAAGVGDAAFNQLFPIYPQYSQNFTVLPGNGTDNGNSLADEGISASDLFSLDWFGSWATGLSDALNASLVPLYRDAIANLSDPYLADLSPSSGVGSNSWVVAANHSSTGTPLLANDPHLPIMLPSLWVSTQLVSPDFDVEGWSLAGLLGVLIGHNDQLAWGLTNSEGATALDYVETLQGDSYLQNGTWHPLSWTNESIRVAGRAPVAFDLAWTDNGPIVARVGDYGLSVRWAGTGATWEAIAELDFDRAQSIPQFFQALADDWSIPNLNAVVAQSNASDPAGHIAWVVPARFPLVAETLPDGQHVDVIGSRGPLNGSGGYEPVGTVPFDQLPQVEDPAQGYLFAPNQPTVGPEYAYPFIGSWWDSGGRAHTIGVYLQNHTTMSMASMEGLQANVTDSWSLALAPSLLQTLEALAPASPLAQAAVPYLEAFNGSFDVGSVAATIYTYWWNALVTATYDAPVSALGISGAPSAFPSAYAWLAANDPDSSWFPGGFAHASTLAALAALDLLAAHLGIGPTPSAPNLSGWTWGRVHTFVLPSLTGVSSLAAGPYPEWGDSYTPSVAPFTDNSTFPLQEVAIGSSLRFVTEPGLGPSVGVLPGGASEDPASAYYDDLLPLWLDHQYVSMTIVPTSAGPFPEGVVSTWTLQP